MALTPEQARQLYDELNGLLGQQWRSHADTLRVASFLRVHAADLKIIVAVGNASSLLWQAAYAGNADVLLALLEAGAQRDFEGDALYFALLKNDHIYDLNGHVLDDADIARRLRVLYDVHGVRLEESGFMSFAIEQCVRCDRLECLKVMIEIDPQACGYTQRGCNSLLHLAASFHKPHIVRFLLENGWSETDADLDYAGLSTLSACLVQSSKTDPAAICDTLDVLLHDVEDATAVIRSSGLCDAVGFAPVLLLGDLPLLEVACMHVYVCAAVQSYSSLPRCVLHSRQLQRFSPELDRSPVILASLPMDEHVHTGIGDPIYFHDSLRVTSSFDGAARYAVAVDALCFLQSIVRTDSKRVLYRTCLQMLRKSRTPIVTSVSPTLRDWAWMRRLHAVAARQQMLQRGMRQSVQPG